MNDKRFVYRKSTVRTNYWEIGYIYNELSEYRKEYPNSWCDSRICETWSEDNAKIIVNALNHKYPTYLDIEIPKGAKILTVQEQNRGCVLWCMVNPNNQTEMRTFKSFITGESIPDKPLLNYIGTVQLGSDVTHIFEQK